jgi:hypothetical protein
MPGHDPTSLAGKRFPTRGHFDHVVVGGGEAGIAAARAAVAAGEHTLLVDEHPLDPGLFGLDIPYLFGGRVDPAVQSPARMQERIVAARPGLLAALEDGVEIALATACWGCFPRTPVTRTQPHHLLGLADRETAWLVAFGQLTIATGARDVVIPYRGWTLPGVMGARGFDAALRLYGAFSGRRLAILGGGALADATERAARAAGLDVVLRIATPPAELEIHGKDEVDGLSWRATDADGRADVAVDTVVMAVACAPMVDLADQAGCAIAWEPERGGFAPVIAPDGGTSIPGLRAVGEAAAGAPNDRAAWLTGALADPAALLCACEDVTAGDLKALRPPRYLGAAGPEAGLDALPGNDQDHVKRLTRAGMGACQGRRCRDSVHALISRDRPARLASHRAPLRPLPLAVLAALEEDPEIATHWTGWFGIPAQWLPHWEPVPEDHASIAGAGAGTGTGTTAGTRP